MTPGVRFAHRLALAVGEVDVLGMLARMPLSDLRRWQAYFGLEPWGEERADVRTAIVAATTFNLQRGQGQRARRVEEFMAVRPSKADTTAAHTAALRAFLGKQVSTDADTE